jgi:hypothetical protein
MRLLLAVLSFTLLGCGADEATPAAPPAADPPPMASPSAALTEESPAETPTPRIMHSEAHTALTASQRGEVARLLGRGRRAARSGDHAGALALLRQAIAIDDQRPVLLCEAGWAAFHVHDTEARAYLERGAMLSNVPAQRAACLYNLGRWHERRAEEAADEASAEHAAAIAAYGDSLALRPANAETAARYRALAGRDYQAVACDPPGRFPTVEAACAELLASIDDSDGVECALREPEDDGMAVPTEGSGPGSLAAIAYDESNFIVWHLVHRTDRGIEFLGEIGQSWDRSCSWGGVELRARWEPVEGEGPLLVVDVHAGGEYGCDPESPRDRCYVEAESEDRDTAPCELLDEEVAVEVTDEAYRMICAPRGGRYRCSTVGSLGTTPASARPGPMPTGAALEALLVCPPGPTPSP